jgi:two-component system, NarL family, nitrate/nitrite response regulator NarL
MSEARAPRVRVFVADDHPVYREGVSRAIKARPEFELVGEAEDGREALEAIKEILPDVAVLDVQMPGLQGSEVLHAVRRDGVPTRIVLLSAHVDSETVYRAVASGAGAYLSKESSRERILDAVAAVARGEVVLSAEVQAGLASEIQIRERDERPALTPREHEILVLTANGHSAPDIGKQLHLSQSTVKTHLKSLYEKLGVSDRAAAVAESMRRGLLE